MSLAPQKRSKIVIEIPRVDHEDAVIVRRQELHEAVGVGVLEQQQRPAGVGGRLDIDARVVAAEEDLVLVLFRELRAVIERADGRLCYSGMA